MIEIPEDAEEITPDGSVARVFLVPSAAVEVDFMPGDAIAALAAAREAGVAKLKDLGLTDEQARAIAGG